MKFTVPEAAVNVPAVPLINVPPAFKVPPVPENTICDATPADVMLPVTFTIPVVMLIWLTLVPVVPCRATVNSAVKVPAPTLIWFVLLLELGRCMLTAPLAVNDAVLSARVIEAFVPAVKSMVVHCAA